MAENNELVLNTLSDLSGVDREDIETVLTTIDDVSKLDIDTINKAKDDITKAQQNPDKTPEEEVANSAQNSAAVTQNIMSLGDMIQEEITSGNLGGAPIGTGVPFTPPEKVLGVYTMGTSKKSNKNRSTAKTPSNYTKPKINKLKGKVFEMYHKVFNLKEDGTFSSLLDQDIFNDLYNIKKS